MPARDTRVPDGLPTRILDWLIANPGEHRARDVAAGLGRPEEYTRAEWSQKVANAMNRLVTGQGRGAGSVMRRYTRPQGYKMRIGLYAAAPRPPEETAAP